MNEQGWIVLSDGRERIRLSPVGILVRQGIAYAPEGAEQRGGRAAVRYPCGVCELALEEKDGYWRIELLSVPAGTDGFLFGPYRTGAREFGEVLGAGWYGDGSAVCLQSLMPKVEEGNGLSIREDRTGLGLRPSDAAAERQGDGGILQCFVRDRSADAVGTNAFELKGPDGLDAHIEMPVRAELGPDARPEGAAAALLCADSADELLDRIGRMELAEGLPHPTYLGQYAKTDKRVSSYYLILDRPMTNEERIAAAERAGVSCVYFDDVIDRWGHFTVDRRNFPGGEAEVAALAERARRSGILIGAHSLSNFIRPNDPYVSPVPHERLLVMDVAALAADLGPDDAEIRLSRNTNYEKRTTLNVFRIGDELITYEAFDAETATLSGCVRGAFGTVPAPHARGEAVRRLVDHGYGVVFPDIVLQDEMADALGRLIRDCGIRRMSFDGLEGCSFTGHGTYARCKFVKRVFDVVGSELLSDGSNTSNYLWHAFSYCNWGEPWYDQARRGGQTAHRECNQEFFRRNLIPRMTGWYQICAADGRWEATPPENMEFILSRAVAYDAGSALVFVGDHGLFGEYLDLVRRWGRFRREAAIPEELRRRMRDEFSNWHLEETETGWRLTELAVRSNDLMYCDRAVRTEAGQVGREAAEGPEAGLIRHAPVVIWDRQFPGVTVPEPLRFRIRVGEPGCGRMRDLRIYGQLSFRFTAEGGDLLVYEGGRELKHYDGSFHLLETVAGEGEPVDEERCRQLIWGQFEFDTDDDRHARYILTEARVKAVHELKPRAENA